VSQLLLFDEEVPAAFRQGQIDALGSTSSDMPNFYEFFAGGGMARAGLGHAWTCLFANDFDVKKAEAYRVNWGLGELRVADVAALKARDLPGEADLVWGSFPCQDLSLAGGYLGLSGHRSGTFWEYWRLVRELCQDGRAPKLVAIENVCGAISSHDGKDFAEIGSALARGGYRFGAVVLDAVHFVPQSRPRLFIIGVRKDVEIDASLLGEQPDPNWHPENLVNAQSKMPVAAREAWVWWRLPSPPKRSTGFVDLIEDNPEGVRWHSPSETKKLLGMMSDVNRKKLERAKRIGYRAVGGLYKRTRINEEGIKVQRAEVRFDDVAGCLRTPSGGSSRQSILLVEGKEVRSRLLSPREAARLMGLPDDYVLPKNYNDAYHLVGDGVAVPVVRFLSENLLTPLARPEKKRRKAAA